MNKLIKLVGLIKLRISRSKKSKLYTKSLEEAYIKRSEEVYKLRQQLKIHLMG